MHGGVKVYRGAASGARRYLEADQSRADDYYLAEGTGLAQRYVATPSSITRLGHLEDDAYEAWVAGLDPETGEPRGRLRTDGHGVRFVEVVVNGPKTWSLAAAVSPEISAAYDEAMDRAAGEIIGWLAEHATTRVGPRGGQVSVPVESLEAAVVRHYTSRAGDPHRHLHLQMNARVFAQGTWRGLDTVAMRDSIEAINGIGHAAVMCDPHFRQVLAEQGFTLDAEGEIVELRPFVGAFSARARQIGQHKDRYEADWRADHPGQEPGRQLLRAWDARAWADARPDKVTVTDGAVLVDEWAAELHRLGYQPRLPALTVATRPGELDRKRVTEVVLSRLGARRSGWNPADVRGEVEQLLTREQVVTPGVVRRELAADLAARAVAACVPLLDGPATADHIRALTSPEVLAVENDITTRLQARGAQAGVLGEVTGDEWLDPAQVRTVRGLAGSHPLVVVEGAAGAGKTQTLAAARQVVLAKGQRMVVVTPTLKAAQVAASETGATAFSAAWLVHQHGFRWNEDGHWTRTITQPRPDAVLRTGDLLLVDEAGMLDQDTASALLTAADEAGARVGLVGDRHQLPPVGRGGVLDLAISAVQPAALLTLDTIHRFSDPAYADLSLKMRDGTAAETVFDQLHAAGHIRVHADETARTAALVDAAATGELVIADDRATVWTLNWEVTRKLVYEGRVGRDCRDVTVSSGDVIYVGSPVATRRNNALLGVTNRDTWTVTRIGDDGSLHLAGDHGRRTLPPGYVHEFVELAHATTVHGAQGATAPTAHFSVSDSTTSMAAYVAMTRGRHANTAHLIADNLDDARQQWVDVFAREQADLGPADAARKAAIESGKYVSPRQRLHRPNPQPPSVLEPHRYAVPSLSEHHRPGPGIGC